MHGSLFNSIYHVLQFLLKNVITAVIERRKTYKTGVKGFKHAFGHGAVPSKFVSVSAGGSSHTETPNRFLELL